MTIATVGAVVGIGSSIYGMTQSGKGGGGGATSGSTQKEIDPRLQNYIYGPNGKGGLLGDTSAIYNAGKGGLNQQMVDGLNRQYGVYSDPGNAAGYQNMARMGQSLMSNGVAGNPFTQGGPGAGLLSNIKGLQSQAMPGMGMGMPGGGMGMGGGGYGGGMGGGYGGGMGGMLNPPTGAPAAHPGNTPPPSMQGGPFKLPDAAAFSATPIPKPDPSTGTDTGYTGAYDGRPITTEMLSGNSAPVWDGKGSFQDWNRKYNQWNLENEGSRGGS